MPYFLIQALSYKEALYRPLAQPSSRKPTGATLPPKLAFQSPESLLFVYLAIQILRVIGSVRAPWKLLVNQALDELVAPPDRLKRKPPIIPSEQAIVVRTGDEVNEETTGYI